MNKQAEFHAAESAVIEAEAKLKSIGIALEGLEKEIGILTVVEGNLLANLNTLRRKEIIPLADQYRKAKSDLNVAQTRLSFLRVDRETHLRAKEKAEKNVEKMRERLQWAWKKLYEQVNNVVQGNFGRRNDGQE